jgi:ankyrin repeat protein
MSLIDECKRGDLEEVKRLLSKGADVHIIDDLAFTFAVNYNHLEIVKLLLAHGVNLHKNYNKASYIANFRGNFEVLNYLNKQMLLEKLKCY